MRRAGRGSRLREITAHLRRILVCGAILAVVIVAFDLWRGPRPDRGLAFAAGVLLVLLGTSGVWAGLRPAEADDLASPSSFLAYDRFRFLWLALGLSALAVGSYLLDAPPGGRSGGSWLGYTLGSLAFAAMLWLMWFGVRKRSYASRGAPLRAWLSAHVYLGLALLVVMPLHSAFEFGWNVHTGALALAVLAIATGIAGIGFYSQVPSPMTRNRPGQKLSGLVEQVAEIDARCRASAARLPDTHAQAVEDSIQRTRIGGGPIAQIRARGSTATREAIERLETSAGAPLTQEVEQCRIQTLELLAVKERLLQRISRDLRYKAALDLWLLLHVPLAFAAVVAVSVHVFVVFYYR